MISMHNLTSKGSQLWHTRGIICDQINSKKVDGNGGARDNTVAAGRKPKAASATTKGKVRKEKIGGKICALQQLVSPFGRTESAADTTTVLHEAIGYIRFLHGQVQVLSSAYWQPTGEQGVESKEGDLRSRGLCLVPVSSTGNMTNTGSNTSDIVENGAIFGHQPPTSTNPVSSLVIFRLRV